MNIARISVIGLICVILAVTIKRHTPHIAVILSLCGGLIIMLDMLPMLAGIVRTTIEISKRINVDFQYIRLIMKLVGIAYIAEFCSQICIDCGESAMAGKIAAAGKILILAGSLPVITGMIEMIDYMLG